ncbi:DNA-directed RNA polymerase subunit L [Candidatus Woesearchaeota archaeon]|nr:DNA-directed RNA polymerase subunit L [Candidatus Woesearchaeota archaeon]
MELNILKEEKDIIELEICGETHTFCNALRSELWNQDEVKYAAYAIKHPLVGIPVFVLNVNKGKPKKILADAAESLKGKVKEFKSLIKSI